MIRIIFALIIVVHALIHLMGFVKAFKLADIPQLTLNVSKFNGVLWLCTAMALLSAGTLFLLRNDDWWMLAVPGALLSQSLIFITWHDAKYGTIANVLVVAGSVLAYGSWSFNSMVSRELKSLLPSPLPAPMAVTQEMISSQPPVIQRWLRRSNVPGKEIVHSVHLHQRGEMRTDPLGKWMPVDAEQYLATDPPGFIWIADVEFLPMLHLAGRDKYLNGKGHMLISALSLLPVVDTKGKELDQSTMVRYLAELVWFPTAALRDYISWEQVDSNAAKATMKHAGIEVSGTFTFTPDGDMKTFEAMRFYDRKEGATLEKWRIDADPDGAREFEGIRIPSISTVTWSLKEGDFTWYKLEITDIQYNKRTE